MRTLVLTSEKGGVAKSTVAALIAAAAARRGVSVTAVDLDPRATLTGLMRAEFRPGYSVDAILAAEDPTGWAGELRVPCGWDGFGGLSLLPSERSLGNRERAREDHAEHRLGRSLQGLDADLVVVDTPPRAGGVLVLSALALPDARVIYATTPDQDGLDGIAQGWATVGQAREYLNAGLRALGIAVSRVDERLVDARRCLRELGEIYGDLVLSPVLPERVAVREARAAADWVGHYTTGAEIAARADQLWQSISGRLEQKGSQQ